VIGDWLWVGNEQTQAGKGDYPNARGSNPTPIAAMNHRHCISGAEVFALPNWAMAYRFPVATNH